MPQETLEAAARVIQSALAPVFLLSAIAALALEPRLVPRRGE
jgi:hypothetical protein